MESLDTVIPTISNALENFALSAATDVATDHALRVMHSFFVNLECAGLNFTNSNTSNNSSHVCILKNGNNAVLSVNGNYTASLMPGAIEEISLKKLEQIAEAEAANFNCDVTVIELPEALHEDGLSDSAVIELAKKMGYYSEYGSIFDLFEDTTILVNGLHCPYSLNGDWIYAIANEEDDKGSVIIWDIALQSGFMTFEYSITFDELCSAKTNDGKTWFLKYTEETELRITFLQPVLR